MLINRFALFSSVSMSKISELNNIGIVAAYSLRRLFLNYAGPLIRVRRTSDNDTQDISADADGNLNTTALLAFVGGTGNDGYVVRWYDQSGGDFHAEQGTVSRQPQIVDDGVVMESNGKPEVDFGNRRACMAITNNMHAQLNTENIPMATFSVQTLVEATIYSNDLIFDIRRLDGSASLFIAPYRRGTGADAEIEIRRKAPGSTVVHDYESGLPFPLTQSLAAYLFDGTNAVIYSNNTAADQKNNYTISGEPTYQRATLGGLYHPTGGELNRLNGSIQEFVLYNIDKASDRAAIMSNIMGHWGIS